jgi:phosphonate transport system substrate-binding protein
MKTNRIAIMIGLGLAGFAALAIDGLAQADRSNWPKEVVYATIPTDASKDATQRYAPLVAHLEKSLGLKIKFQNGADYAAVIVAQRAKQVDIADYGANSYLDAIEQGANVEAVAIPDNVKGGATYKSIIVVGKNSSVKTMADAKGKTFAFVDPESTSGYLIPLVYFLKDLKVKPEEYFSKVAFAGTHENSLLSVSRGTVEVGAANDQNLLLAIDKGVLKTDDIRIIWTSKPIPNGPTAIRKDLPESFRKAVKEAFLAFKDPKGLDGFNIKGFLPVDDKDFDPIRDAREVKKSLKK